MRTQDWVRFIALCLIWSSSFVFIRVCAPVLGPVLTAAARLGIAGIVLVVYLRVIGFDSQFRKAWATYLRIGLIGSRHARRIRHRIDDERDASISGLTVPRGIRIRQAHAGGA